MSCIGTGFICSSLCYNKERAYFAWKHPSRKASSERTMNITNDKYLYQPKVNEGIKYGSYVRVLRRRRNQNDPCSKDKGQLCRKETIHTP
jgi:hypothetical protein